MSGLLGLISATNPPDAGAEALFRETRTGLAVPGPQRVDTVLVGGGLHIASAWPEGLPGPTTAEDPQGGLWVALCGEAYQKGHIDAARAADCLAACRDHGCDGLTRLDGAFLLVVHDRTRDLLHLVTDRFGQYPHYWLHRSGRFAFAPRLRALLPLADPSPALDMTAVAEYLRFQQLLGDRTWFEGISAVPPASILTYDRRADTVVTRRYWDWSDIPSLPRISFDEAVDEANRRFDTAVRKRMAPPLRPGLYLSGGLDARSILGSAEHLPVLQTLTYGAQGSRDVVLAQALAKAAGRPHTWVPFRDGRWVLDCVPTHVRLTEGFHSWMHLHGLSTLDTARRLMDVNLSGWVGGTLMATYRHDVAWDQQKPFRYPRDEPHLRQMVFDGFSRAFTWPGLTEAEAWALTQRLHGGRLLDAALESFSLAFDRTIHHPPAHRLDGFVIEQQDRRSVLNGVTFLRSAIEVRCPFADYDFVDFIYGLPPAIKADPRFRREMLTRRMPALARIPMDKTNTPPHTGRLVQAQAHAARRLRALGSRLFPSRFPRTATLYADYEQYLRTDLRAWGEWLLFDRRTTERGLFDPAAVRSLWERHQAGHELHTIGRLAPLMTIEMVIRYLVEGEDPERLVPEHVK